MLLSLSIKNLVLIDALHLNMEQGLTVLTGETGAGKSILLDALGLALGMRGDVSLIRHGAEQAVVSAEFCIKNNPVIVRMLHEHGLSGLDDDNVATLVFRRVLIRKGSVGEIVPEGGSTAGRSRAFINDQMVSVGLLRLLGNSLLEIHGQFDRLLEPASYRLLLDEYAGSQNDQHNVTQAYETWQAAHQEWQQADNHLTTLRQNEGFLKQQFAELKKLNPVFGEEENLLKEREDLAHVGKLSEAAQDVKRYLQPSAIEAPLHAATKTLHKVLGQGGGKIDSAHSALERALAEIIEAQAQVQDVVDQLANHPQRLQEIDERLYALRAAARKYSAGSSDLAALQENLENQLESLDHAVDLISAHLKSTSKAWTAYTEMASILHHRRTKASKTLEEAVMAELPALKLPQAKFAVQVLELPQKQWGQTGKDRIDFMVAMNKGQELCSLSKSASGGELARLMLTLKVVLASRSSIHTIIFDEIDTGVGGAVAAAIGERLAILSKHVQVLAITHSPQLAACARHHLLVYKQDYDTFTRTSVQVLSSEDRQNELARMLSGAQVTPEARAAAERLLKVDNDCVGKIFVI